jgi:dTDP-4-dehydrorhamnose reductase
MRIHPRTLIVRTGPLFSGTAEASALVDNAVFDTIDDREIVTPTHRDDLVHAVIDLLIDGEQGIWHLTNGTSLSWGQFQLMAAGTEPVVGNTRAPRHVRTTSHLSSRFHAPWRAPRKAPSRAAQCGRAQLHARVTPVTMEQ